jgi:hypothetical protein
MWGGPIRPHWARHVAKIYRRHPCCRDRPKQACGPEGAGCALRAWHASAAAHRNTHHHDCHRLNSIRLENRVMKRACAFISKVKNCQKDCNDDQNDDNGFA